MHASTSRMDDMATPMVGPSHGHDSIAPSPGDDSLELDPSGRWLFQIVTKRTQALKRVLKRARQVTSGIPPDGHKKPISKFIPIVSNKP